MWVLPVQYCALVWLGPSQCAVVSMWERKGWRMAPPAGWTAARLSFHGWSAFLCRYFTMALSRSPGSSSESTVGRPGTAPIIPKRCLLKMLPGTPLPCPVGIYCGTDHRLHPFSCHHQLSLPQPKCFSLTIVLGGIDPV